MFNYVPLLKVGVPFLVHKQGYFFPVSSPPQSSSLSILLTPHLDMEPKPSHLTLLLEPFLASLFNSEQNPVIWLRISLPPNRFWAEKVLFSFDLRWLFTGSGHSIESFNCFFGSSLFVFDLIINGFFSLLTPPLRFGIGAEKFGFLFSLSSWKSSEQLGLLDLSEHLT